MMASAMSCGLFILFVIGVGNGLRFALFTMADHRTSLYAGSHVQAYEKARIWHVIALICWLFYGWATSEFMYTLWMIPFIIFDSWMISRSRDTRQMLSSLSDRDQKALEDAIEVRNAFESMNRGLRADEQAQYEEVLEVIEGFYDRSGGDSEGDFNPIRLIFNVVLFPFEFVIGMLIGHKLRGAPEDERYDDRNRSRNRGRRSPVNSRSTQARYQERGRRRDYDDDEDDDDDDPPTRRRVAARSPAPRANTRQSTSRRAPPAKTSRTPAKPTRTTSTNPGRYVPKTRSTSNANDTATDKYQKWLAGQRKK